MSTASKWRGLKSIVADAVEHGSRAVERVHLATTKRTFTILEHIPPIAAPTRVVHALHDAGVGAGYGAVRLVNRAVSATLDVVLTVAEQNDRDAADSTRDANQGPQREPVDGARGPSDAHTNSGARDTPATPPDAPDGSA